MYGVPADLDLSRLKNGVLVQLCLGQYQLQFHFHPSGSISVEGKWELRDADDMLVDGGERDVLSKDAIRAHRLLGKRVNEASVDAPRSFSLCFEGGDVLTIYDDSSEYESFSIQPGNIFV
jgi:hypothetical protein